MAKTINFKYNKEDYTLEFDRESVKHAERLGFDYNKVETMPMNMIPILVRCAFIKNHSDTKTEVADEIYSKIGNKAEFVAKLIEMYVETLNTLFDEEEDEKNLAWGASW